VELGAWNDVKLLASELAEVKVGKGEGEEDLRLTDYWQFARGDEG